MLCPGCGNEVEPNQTCPVCENQAATKRPKRASAGGEAAPEETTSFCAGCGNTIYGPGPCEICGPLGAAPKKNRTVLCSSCGNTVPELEDCPICGQGRGGGRARRGTRGIPVCLNCDAPMARQEWDGIEVHMCVGCQALLFPPRSLEAVLDKLREATEDLDFNEVLSELRGQHDGRRLTKSIRYRSCPVCDEAMSRMNYGQASGIMIEHCMNHGTWVEQPTFADLSDWISRGGDQLTRRVTQRRPH